MTATPVSIRRMGDGYEPHVDAVEETLVYSLPVDSGFVSLSFAFEVEEADLAVMLTDPYRRAALEVVAHTVLQRSMLRGNPEVGAAEFRLLVDRTLHATPDALAAYLAEIDRAHHIATGQFIQRAIAGREATPCDS